MSSIYLGADVGTTSAKCLAVNEDGIIITFTQHPYTLSHPKQGWAEQDPEDFRIALSDVVRRCMEECKSKGYSSSDVKSLAMSTQGDTLIVTDDSGKPLAPSMSWMDARADVEFRELLAETGPSFWYQETGQPMNPLSSACKMRWLSKNKPELRGARYAWVADFLAKRLCGEFTADMPSGSWTSIFSPSKREWSKNVLKVLGLSVEGLPKTVDSGEIIGELLPDACAEMGLALGTKLIAGAFDQSAAAYGSGATASGRSVLSCGTAWVLYSVSSQPIYDASEHLCSCCHTGKAEWGLVLPFTGGSAYDWLTRTIGDALTGSPSDSEPLIFVPHLYGGLSPDWRGESKGSLLGLTMAHTREDIRLALMRGVACETRRNMEAGEPYCGRSESVIMVGGAGKSKSWPQMIADVLNISVEVSGLLESACFGAAKLAAGDASSPWPSTNAVRIYEPTKTGAETENRFYERYLRAYKALLELYKD